MKGIFIPLLFAIFGGRAICEGNLPTGIDPNMATKIYANPQNTHPSKLSDAPITHERKLEDGGKEMSPSVTSPNNHNERRLDDTTAKLEKGIECKVEKKVESNFWSREKEIITFKCSKTAGNTSLEESSGNGDFDINTCITNNNGNLGYSESGGGFVDTCKNCRFSGSQLHCDCRPGTDPYKATNIDLNNHIALRDDKITCRQKNENLFITVNNISLDQLILRSRLCPKQENQKDFNPIDCIAYDGETSKFKEKKAGDNTTSDLANTFEKCEHNNWTLKCEKNNTSNDLPSLDIDLNDFVDFTKCPLECKKEPEAQKKSLI